VSRLILYNDSADELSLGSVLFIFAGAGKKSGSEQTLGFAEVIMFADNVVVWVLEYIFGGMLVVIPLANLALPGSASTDTRIWSVQLFVVCLGVVLISCASSMRQRMLLSKRIEKLTEQIKQIKTR